MSLFTKKQFTILPGLLILSAVVVSCTQEPSVEQARADLCRDLAELQQNLAALEAISPNSSIGDLKQAKADVAESFKKVQAAREEVEEAKIEELEVAHTDLETAVSKISEKDSIADAAGSVQPEVQKVEAARAQLFSTVKCQ
ncbi:MAG: hypothetical protein ACFBSC_09585 [Microcoleaceae cyanobacterium]